MQNAGVWAYDLDKGSMGTMLVVDMRGHHLIVSPGLEKLVPSAVEAGHRCAKLRWRHSPGQDIGFILLQSSEPITETQALAILAGAKVTLVPAGGVDGSEGTAVLALEGRVVDIDMALGLIDRIKGEPPTTTRTDLL